MAPKKTPVKRDAPENDSHDEESQTHVPETKAVKTDSTSASGDDSQGSMVGKDWVWDLEDDVKLTVSKFKGKTYVDVRHLWEGKPTKKGIHVSVETFKKLCNFSKLEEALSKV